MTSDLPQQHRALVLEDFKTVIQLKNVPTPQPIHGSAVVKVLAVGMLSYGNEIYSQIRPYPFPMPLVVGYSAIARIVAPGPDATLKPGQLVWADCVIRARDDPTALFLTAIHQGSTEGSKKLMKDVWRDGTLAEYAKVPLENCIALDEARLCKSLGYSFEELAYISYLLVPFGGLRDIKVEPGETVVVCPATGGFGGACVLVAVAMGARVIAMGRNEKELARLKERAMDGTPGSCVETVKITGDKEKDTAALRAFGTIDAVLDLSPPAAAKSTHVQSAIASLRHSGYVPRRSLTSRNALHGDFVKLFCIFPLTFICYRRVSLMGLAENITPDPWTIIGNDITLKGKLMYSREDMLLFVKMFERGLFPKGEKLVDAKVFGLDDFKKAFDEAGEYMGLGKLVVVKP